MQLSPGKRSRAAASFGLDPVQASGGQLRAADPQAAADRGLSGSATDLPFLPTIQASFGRYDISGVEAHRGGAAREACDELGASAFARGDQIAFAGAPDLHTAAHEAAHVVQQQAGVHLAGGVGREGDAYEQHADAVADAVVTGVSAESLLAQMAPAPSAMPARGGAIQRRPQVDGLAEPPTPDEKLKFLHSLPMQDILDTLSAPKGRGFLPELLANEDRAPADGIDRLGAAMRAAAGRIDAAFWMKFGRMHVSHPADVPVIEAKVGKKEMSAEKRMGTISSSVIGQLRSGDPDVRKEAFLYLNGLNMHDILDVLVIVRSTGLLLTPQFVSDAAAAPIHQTRLLLAARAVDEIDRRTAAEIETDWGAGWTTLGPDGNTIRDWVQNSPQAKFRKLVDDDRLIRDGQFQLQRRMSDQLRALAPSAGALAADFEDLINAAFGDPQVLHQLASRFRANMSAQGISDPALVAATRPGRFAGGNPKAIGEQIFSEWWARYQKDKTADVTPYVNVFALHAHHQAALILCGAETGQIGTVYQNARKAAGETKDPRAAFSGRLGTSVSREATILPGTSTSRGDVIRYGDLAGAVTRMKAALDGGWVLHARVLSGATGSGNPDDPTEHSLLIIGYRGNAFVVSDSDPKNEGRNDLKTGFTTLFFDPGANRLSTAPDEASFVVAAAPGADGRPVLGNHQVDGHHRYQVWSVSSM